MTFNFNTCLPGMLSACSYVYADKFTACVQNVHLPNACMHRNVSCVHVRCSVRQSWCPSELQNFVELGVKINGAYYRDVLLTQKLLPVIRQISGNEFVFQQDSAPAHNAHETVELLCRETHWTLFHRNSGHRTVQILTRWIQNLAYNAAARLPDKDSKCWRTATASAERLQQHWTRRHRRIRWPVACATQSTRAFGRQTFWIHAVNLSA